MKIILGQEAIAGAYGLGRVTEISSRYFGGEPSWIGVTPYVAGYQMNFAPGNIELIPLARADGETARAWRP